MIFTIVACTLPVYTDSADPSNGATSAHPATGSATSSALTSGSTTTSTSGTSQEQPTTSGAPADLPRECDYFVEDCPQGQKCAPVSLDGDYLWDHVFCVPIAPSPAEPGEPCTYLGKPRDGHDTCDKHSFCFGGEDTGTGVCVALCVGSEQDLKCQAPEDTCWLWSDSEPTVYYCVANCDPLLPSCPLDWLCLPNGDFGFTCIEPLGDLNATFGPCNSMFECVPGDLCVDSSLAVECDPMVDGCCLPYCDLNGANKCPGEGQVCLPLFLPGQAPPGSENVGVCGLPQP